MVEGLGEKVKSKSKKENKLTSLKVTAVSKLSDKVTQQCTSAAKKTYLKVDEAVVVLRRSLADAEDKSITIVTVGFLTNIRSFAVTLFHTLLNMNAVMAI